MTQACFRGDDHKYCSGFSLQPLYLEIILRQYDCCLVGANVEYKSSYFFFLTLLLLESGEIRKKKRNPSQKTVKV